MVMASLAPTAPYHIRKLYNAALLPAPPSATTASMAGTITSRSTRY
jgi:hypothetical protein